MNLALLSVTLANLIVMPFAGLPQLEDMTPLGVWLGMSFVLTIELLIAFAPYLGDGNVERMERERIDRDADEARAWLAALETVPQGRDE